MQVERALPRRNTGGTQDGEMVGTLVETRSDSPAEAWLPLVRWVLYRLLPAHVRARAEDDDLYQAGVVGLLNTRRLYDPTKGAKFITYATHKIRWAMLIEAGLTRHGWTPLPERLPDD